MVSDDRHVGARLGRVDGVPDSGTHDGHVGEMLRIATVPAKALASPKKKKKHVPPPVKCIVAPGGKVMLARTKSGHCWSSSSTSIAGTCLAYPIAKPTPASRLARP